MPEGPEVFTSAKFLNSLFNGWLIELIHHHTTKCLKGILQGRFVPGAQIMMIRSRGKKLIFDLSNDDHLLFAYLMEGRLLINQKPDMDAHRHFTICLYHPVSHQRTQLYYYESRPFGGLTYCHGQNELNNALSCVGLDLIQDDITPAMWISIMRTTRSKKSIAEILLNQRYLAGIGNYLRCDILYRCQIHPLEMIGTLTDEDLLRLYYATMWILSMAVQGEGLSAHTYTLPDGRLGRYQALVYNRPVDDYGNPVAKMSLGGRTVHYVPNVQIKKTR